VAAGTLSVRDEVSGAANSYFLAKNIILGLAYSGGTVLGVVDEDEAHCSGLCGGVVEDRTCSRRSFDEGDAL